MDVEDETLVELKDMERQLAGMSKTLEEKNRTL